MYGDLSLISLGRPGNACAISPPPPLLTPLCVIPNKGVLTCLRCMRLIFNLLPGNNTVCLKCWCYVYSLLLFSCNFAWIYTENTYIKRLTSFSHGCRQKLQNATCYDPYILLSPRPFHTSDHTYVPVASTTHLNFLMNLTDKVNVLCPSRVSPPNNSPMKTNYWNKQEDKSPLAHSEQALQLCLILLETRWAF